MEASPFAIDTGADQLYLDSELAKVLNPSSWGERESLGTKPRVRWSVSANFDLGRVALKNTVVFLPEFAPKHASLDNRRVGRVKRVSLSGEHETLAGRIEWFEFAGHRLEKPVVQFGLRSESHVSQQSLAGIIWPGFLRDVIVVFFPESKMALLPEER